MFEEIDVKSSPKWGRLIFADGYDAQIVGMMPSKIDGKDCWEFKLRPYEPLILRYKIKLDEVTPDWVLKRSVSYLQEHIISINLDPIHTAYRCLVKFDGTENPLTTYLKERADAEIITSLKENIRMLKARNAYLTEDNMKARTKVYQFIKENSDALSGVMVSAFKSIYPDKEDGTRG